MKIFSILLLFFSSTTLFSQVKEVVIGTYLGNEQRNYYGNKAPENLDETWKLNLSGGISPAYGNPLKLWKGAGWTGQPLYVREETGDFLILGAFDYNLKKINAQTGQIVWEYRFDDILKGTGTFWENKNDTNPETKYLIIQGSRLGYWNSHDDKYIPSLRAVSYLTGKELWRLNSKKTDSYSRDVDGSAIIVNDTAYLALENGLFTVFNPDPAKKELLDERLQPKVYKEIQYYNKEDIKLHGKDLVSESSPTLLNDAIYTPSGSGHVYGYNIKTGKNTWDFFTGTDMNGSAPVTYDSCLVVAVEKQYMPGKGGVLKLNPKKTGEDAVVWFFPTENKKWFHWEGGIIGSVAVNDAYVGDKERHIAIFIDVAGYLFVVEHDKIDNSKTAIGPDRKTKYPMPKLLFKEKIEGTISTPIIVKDKIIAATDNGLFLYKIDLKNNKLTLLDKVPGLEIDATPIAVDGKIYIASRNGYLYCFGKK
ncbi:MAG: PQQ-binding-like beta-propeller repeat protein [Bacteroidales bacterium]|nr:PQQ-binding-like beta-propeller repeat protein [Bacteroidales bacterium]